MSKTAKINGQKIHSLHTLGSMYDQDSLRVGIGNDYTYRLQANEIVKMLNEFRFELKKKRKYTYLVNPELIEDIK